METFRMVEWDTDFCGFRVAKIVVPTLNLDELSRTLLAFARVGSAWLAEDPSWDLTPSDVATGGGLLVDERTT